MSDKEDKNKNILIETANQTKPNWVKVRDRSYSRNKITKPRSQKPRIY